MKHSNQKSALVLALSAVALVSAPLGAQQRSVDGRRRSGFTVRADEIEGDLLARSTADRIPVRFELRREAGSFMFEGEQDGREAWGDFTWTGDADFLGQMARRGYDDISIEQMLSLRIQGVTPSYIGALEKLGYADLSADRLTEFRIHGVTEGFIEEMAAVGYEDLSPDGIVRAKIRGNWRRR